MHMRTYEFEHSQVVARSRDEVFEFFSNAENLEELTPPWLRFRILTAAPIHMHRGARIDYTLRLHGIPIRWTSEISEWEPPFYFVDKQVRGPYRLWVHEHRFDSLPEGTRVSDHVRYAVPGGHLANRFVVAPDLARVFRFRRERLGKMLGAVELPER